MGLPKQVSFTIEDIPFAQKATWGLFHDFEEISFPPFCPFSLFSSNKKACKH
jgi:hypothetical protein